jgi:hypothetical protein
MSSSSPRPPLRVSARTRPLLRRDAGERGDLSVRDADGTIQLGSAAYCFDQVFADGASQQAVAHSCAAPLVDKLFAGVHGCLFAFGQTGAGKTFSMLGAEGGQRRACQDGVLPLATTDIFRRVAQLDAEAALRPDCSSQYQLRVSFVEVYRERVYDLLCGSGGGSGGGSGRQQLRLRELDDGSVRPAGATEAPVHSTAQMLELVAQGSAARATAATDMHEHSSRSHAILTLTLEHRWRDADGPPESRLVHKQQAQLSLVDLAGSEDMTRSHHGAGDQDGIATNLGLHALTRVLGALAAGAPHVPYRDATLTRLLQPALGGDCVTQMLACISPAAADEAETARTLRWAATARGLASRATVHVTEETDTDPMLGDVEDTSALQRRALWLGPIPGCAAFLPAGVPIFARVAGDPSKPLLLYVHGSGPRNSSAWWNEVVQAVDAIRPNAYYHVAIDCPGYARSAGDRQAIRSYPGALLQGIIQASGKRSAAALIGSSQGACAVLNALLEIPSLAETVAVIHPVGHAVERYSAIHQPALLIFDTEDAGHPVEVGRRMRDALPNPTYFEFTHSVHGPWEQQHIAPELVKLLQTARGQGRRQRARADNLPELSVLAGGLRAWSELYGDEHGWDWETPGSSAVAEQEEGRDQTQANSVACAPPVLQPPPAITDALFSEEEEEEEEDEEAAAAAAEAAARAQAEAELQQSNCDLCGGQLVQQQAIRLVRCRHALCASCCDWSLRHFEECPVCETRVARTKTTKKQKQKRTTAAGLPAPSSDAASLSAELLTPATCSSTASSSIPPPGRVVVLSYGSTKWENTGASTGKTNYSTFVKLVDGDRTALERVTFNINPSYTKPTATLTSPNCSGGGVWSFDYAMARPYPCEIVLRFKAETGLPPMKIEYFVQDQRKFSRRVAVELPPLRAGCGSGGGKRTSTLRARGGDVGIVLEEEACTSSGWFLLNVESAHGWTWRPAGA